MTAKDFLQEVIEKYGDISKILNVPDDDMGVYHVNRLKMLKKFLREEV